MDKVSVIIPTYNRAEFIEDALISVYNQKYKNIEIIVCDDGSTDNTPEVIGKFRNDIIYVRQSNQGCAAARNKALSVASGRLIAFLDSDDRWLPGKLKRQIGLINELPDTGLIYSDCFIIDENNSIIKRHFDISAPYKGIVLDRLLLDNFIPISTVLMKKEILDNIGNFNMQYKIAEDWDFLLRLSEKYAVDFINEPLSEYRAHRLCISKNRVLAYQEVIEILGKYRNHKVLKEKSNFIAYKNKKAQMQCNLGLSYLKGSKTQEARRIFVNNIKDSPVLYKSYIGLFLSYLPSGIRGSIINRHTSLSGIEAKGKKTGVCMLTGAYFPEISGGTLQSFNLIETLKQDFDFYVISTFKISSKERNRNKVFSEELIDKTRVFRINFYPGDIVSKVLSFLAVIVIFLKLVNKVQVFHMLGYTRKNRIIAALAKIFRKKIVVKTTSFGEDDPLSIKKGSFVIWCLYSLSDAYVVTSPGQLKSYKMTGLPEKKVFFIPNAVNLKRFNIPNPDEKAALRDEIHIPASSQVILSVSFFSRDKGLDILAESLLLLPQNQLNNLFLIFIGSKDPMEAEVDNLVIERVYDIISHLKLKTRAIFLDSTLEIEKYFKASDIFVLPSKREGLPNALLEAMACGLYCIVNRIKGVTDYIITNNENGYLLDSLSPTCIADALKITIGNNNLQSSIGHKARLRIEEEFDMDKIKDRYANLYRAISQG